MTVFSRRGQIWRCTPHGVRSESLLLVAKFTETKGLCDLEMEVTRPDSGCVDSMQSLT
jgi:hypothetical protein